MRTQEQYLADLARMRPNVYLGGEKIGRDDPRVIHAGERFCLLMRHIPWWKARSTGIF